MKDTKNQLTLEKILQIYLLREGVLLFRSLFLFLLVYKPHAKIIRQNSRKIFSVYA